MFKDFRFTTLKRLHDLAPYPRNLLGKVKNANQYGLSDYENISIYVKVCSINDLACGYGAIFTCKHGQYSLYCHLAIDISCEIISAIEQYYAKLFQGLFV